MDFSNLTSKNSLMFAMKIYDNPVCSGIEEFKEDLNRIKYIRKLLRKYQETLDPEDLKERLILNHIITLNNVFGKGMVRLLFLRLHNNFWSILKTFLVYLNLMPDIIKGINGRDIFGVSIQLDQGTVKKLRDLQKAFPVDQLTKKC